MIVLQVILKQIEMNLILDYILIGIIIGFLSGLIGIGGSAINTPILKILFGLPDILGLSVL